MEENVSIVEEEEELNDQIKQWDVNEVLSRIDHILQDQQESSPKNEL